jgi:hypothetical protein
MRIPAPASERGTVARAAFNPEKGAVWIAPPALGPVIGAAFADGDRIERIPVAAAADPAVRRARAAAFVPVIEVPGERRFIPADLGKVWTQPVGCDGNGWFRLDVAAQSLRGEFDGVLLGLVYSELRLDKAGLEELVEMLLREPFEALRRALIEVRGETPAQAAEITFAVASCQYPAGLLDARVADASYARLARRLDQPGAPQCLLLLGDQIYVDESAGLFDPRATADRFLARYEALYRSEAARDVFRRLAAYTMLDDHEIEDNWEPQRDCGRADPILDGGRRAYLEFQRRAGPPARSPAADSTHPLWYEFARHGFPFFMADTRTERERRTAANVARARIMSRTQFEALLDWLARCDPAIPKFIASPSNFLPRHLRVVRHPANALRSDAWDGYPYSFQRLLAYIAARQIRNVVFLSGDEHISCVARAVVRANGGPPVTLLSVHSSALHAPFPFANATEADFAAAEPFAFDLPNGKAEDFRWGGSYTCEVTSEFAPGDGFAVLRFFERNGKWAMECEFDRERGKVRIVRELEG